MCAGRDLPEQNRPFHKDKAEVGGEEYRFLLKSWSVTLGITALLELEGRRGESAERDITGNRGPVCPNLGTPQDSQSS